MQRCFHHFGLSAALAVALTLSTTEARAEAEGPGPQDLASETATSKKRSEDPMGELGLSLKLGMAHVAAGDIPNPFYSRAAEAAIAADPSIADQLGTDGCSLSDRRCKTRGRFGLQLALTLHMGGDGFGWDVEPYIAFAGHAKAYGVYLGPKFDIHVADPVYIGFGFGAKGAYVVADGWARAADIAGRIPVHAIVYLADNVALVAEFAFGAGASGYLANERQELNIDDPQNPGQQINLGSTPEMTFGVARTWDLTFGIRFP